MSAQQFYSGQPGPDQYQYQQQPPPQAWGNHNVNSNGYEQYPPPQGGGYQPPSHAPPPPQMTSSEPYAEPQHYAPPKHDPSGMAAPQMADARFTTKKRVNDIIPLILFVGVFCGMIVVAGISIRQFVKYNGGGGGFGKSWQGGTGVTTSLNYHTVWLLVISAALALVLSAIYLMIVRAFTKALMEITLALSVLLNIATCVYYFTQKYWSGAIIFLIFSIISILTYWFMRKRIPFARIMLQTVVDVSKHHPSVYGVTIISLIVQTAFNIFYTFTTVAVYVTWTPGNPSCETNSCSSGKVAGLVFYVTFAYIWTSQIIMNVTLMTLSGGVYGQWYYNGPNGDWLKGANTKAFGRAMTTSLGSVAFGSLIVTILEILRQILNVIQYSAQDEGDILGCVCACIASFCVGCVKSLVQWFNKYAYIEISLYGKSYIPAAKDAWTLLKDRGIDALVNDNLVSITLSFGAYVVGLLTAFFGYLYIHYTNPAYNSGGDYTAPIMLFCALIGVNCGLALAGAIESGVSTIFVGLGEDPQVLQERSPALFEEIRKTYPHVLQRIQG